LLIIFGNSAVRANDHSNALAAFKTAWAIAPKNGALPLIEYLREQKRFDEAVEVCQIALVKNKNDWRLYLGLGWVYYERGDGMESAIAEFQKAFAIDETRGDGYFAVAQVLTLEQRYFEADHWYRLAIERNTEYRRRYIARGNNMRSAGNFDFALSIYREAARRFPDFSVVYHQMSWAYRLNEQPKEALDSIEKALALMDPPNERYYTRAGQIYEWQGETDRALDAYLSALAINPDYKSAQRGASRLSGP